MRKDCDSCKYDDFWLDEHCDGCCSGKGSNQPSNWEPADYYEPDTNADVIRRMTDEELAKFLNGICSLNDIYCDANTDNYLEWLKQPYGF